MDKISNEHRAHDLAIAALDFEANRRIASELNGSHDSSPFDIYRYYFKAYESALDAVNKDFHQEQD